ncbi:TrkH family potassium uptake protein [Marinicauda algicola]|uniref:Trk system potassium uptake protein n=1 Tax=Marinicauda algicola TaxID=2029849 RepID=A0A4V6RF50_9PROT|nr:TrkH family potassium uptake protein [Marinicauda algicola]TGY89129.1 TrkH family potassium uptake protein [Marinicauda algicola]
MRHFQIVFLILGLLYLGLAALAALVAITSLGLADGAAGGFFECAVAAGFIGGVLAMAGRGAAMDLEFRAAVALTVGAWIGMPLLASIPFTTGPVSLSFTDAVFEAVSGITTTGSTVMAGLDETAPTILFWRSLLQWIGGIGIIGLSIAILPFLRVGGMQLFQLESSDRSSDRVIARPGNLALIIAGLYVSLTLVCALSYGAAGMTGFEAVNHAMTTVSTGGYSTSDGSMGHFAAGAHWVGIVFMLGGAIPFLTYVRILSRREARRPGAFEEVGGLLLLVAGFTLVIIAARLALPGEDEGLIRVSLFNTISVITTTGYAVGDYQAWGPLALAAFFILTFLGGCAGSTSGGFKTFRIQIMVKSIWRTLQQAPLPHSVVVSRHAGQKLSNADIASVALFAGLYVATFAAGAILLAAFGLDFVTAITASATAVANVGPGLGDVIGPAGNFIPLPDDAKWVLCLIMILGRLEIITILLMITPRFWGR